MLFNEQFKIHAEHTLTKKRNNGGEKKALLMRRKPKSAASTYYIIFLPACEQKIFYFSCTVDWPLEKAFLMRNQTF